MATPSRVVTEGDSTLIVITFKLILTEKRKVLVVLGNIPYGQIILEKAVLGLPKSIGYCGGHTLPSSLSHFFLAISSKVAFTITLGWWLFIALPLNVLDAWPNESSATGDQEWFAMAAS